MVLLAVAFWASDIDRQVAAAEVFAVEHSDGLVSLILTTHFNETKAPRSACHTISNDLSVNDVTGSSEVALELFSCAGVWQTTDIQTIIHGALLSLLVNMSAVGPNAAFEGSPTDGQ